MNHFQVAVSFAGENRKIAELLVRELMRFGLQVFYDKDQQPRLVGHDLKKVLEPFYREAEYFVPVVSSYYFQKELCRLEFESALRRPSNDSGEPRIVAIQLDDTHLPDLPASTCYLPGYNSDDISEAARVLYLKINYPDELEKNIRMAESYCRRGLWDKALVFVQGPEYESHPEGLAVLDEIYKGKNQLRESLRVLLLRWKIIGNSDQLLHKKLANRYIALEEHHQALIHCDLADAIMPGDPVVAEARDRARKKLNYLQ